MPRNIRMYEKGRVYLVTNRTVERWIKQLREENKIEFRGAAKTGGYYVTK